MAKYPCKEYGDFKGAEDRRKHLNMLLLDGCIEYERTYGPNGKPWPKEVPTVSVAASSLAAAPQLTSQIVFQSVYMEGGQEAADICKKVCLHHPKGLKTQTSKILC